MARGRKLRIINDADYGFTDGKDIHVNLERIWEETSCTRDFVSQFAKTFQHELLHVLIGERTRSRTIDALEEERVIRKMLREPWDNSIKQMYKRELKKV